MFRITEAFGGLLNRNCLFRILGTLNFTPGGLR